MNQLRRDFLRLKETVEILSGERGNKGRAALRRGDLGRLEPLTSRPIDSAPTAADFNALRADLDTLRLTLLQLAQNSATRR